MTERDEIPTAVDDSPLYDLGHGVYTEWWSLIDRENWGIVEHHWCQNDDKPIGVPGVAGYWAMGSVPVWPTEPVKWSIEAGTVGSFDGLTLSPSILCPRCGLHGWLRDGEWVPA